MPTVYGLFVGINKYQHVTPLFGCVEDIDAIEEFFTNRIAPESRAFVALRDTEATREAIIDGFRTHLSRAREDDVALFYYCGHGSTEPAPPEWRSFDSDGKNQTLIPVDARANGVYDIAVMAPGHATASGRSAIQTLFGTLVKEGGQNTVTASEVLDGGSFVVAIGDWTATDDKGKHQDHGTFLTIYKKVGGMWMMYRDTWNSSM